MIKAGHADTGNVFAQTHIRRKMDSEHVYMLTCIDSDVVEHSPTIVLLHVYCPVHVTLFEVSREICYSGLSIRYCCYGNHTAGSKPN